MAFIMICNSLSRYKIKLIFNTLGTQILDYLNLKTEWYDVTTQEETYAHMASYQVKNSDYY